MLRVSNDSLPLGFVNALSAVNSLSVGHKQNAPILRLPPLILTPPPSSKLESRNPKHNHRRPSAAGKRVLRRRKDELIKSKYTRKPSKGENHSAVIFVLNQASHKLSPLNIVFEESLVERELEDFFS